MTVKSIPSEGRACMKTGRKESDFEGGLSEEGGIEGSIQFRKSRDQLWLFHPEFYANPWG